MRKLVYYGEVNNSLYIVFRGVTDFVIDDGSIGFQTYYQVETNKSQYSLREYEWKACDLKFVGYL